MGVVMGVDCGVAKGESGVAGARTLMAGVKSVDDVVGAGEVIAGAAWLAKVLEALDLLLIGKLGVEGGVESPLLFVLLIAARPARPNS
jgi:hypothetical protein